MLASDGVKNVGTIRAVTAEDIVAIPRSDDIAGIGAVPFEQMSSVPCSNDVTGIGAIACK